MTESSKKIFSDEVIKDVQSSWKLISTDLLAIGIEIFDRLFVAFPQYQQLFAAFRDVPRTELRSNEKFRSHATSVVTALDSAVASLSEADKLIRVLKDVGKKHVNHNVTRDKFINTQQIIYEAIEAALGDRATDRILSSWNEVLGVAVNTIMEASQP